MDIVQIKKYCNSLVQYSRRETIEVNIGGIPMGGNNPIRIQSMTTLDTMDTMGSVEQTIRMYEAGCEYVRLTAPSLNEAYNLQNIKDELRKRGCNVPLVADIHFTPNAAEAAARIVEKVRINPGNYVDKKKFDIIDYTDDEYAEELQRIRDKFTPLVQICKDHGTAMRIGTNHGSLSDRIMSRYGDTPLGMVESALEFLRIADDLDYHDIVLSMKASNTRVMIQAYRLLVHKLEEEGLKPYPLHLGVTEAGEAEDGRIKSAVGIGTLLEDGLGDTIRVSLTEEPEYEAPVAKMLADRYVERQKIKQAPIEEPFSPINPFEYQKRDSAKVFNIGGDNVPRVIANMVGRQVSKYEDLASIGHIYIPNLDKFKMADQGADYIYSGSTPVPFMLPNGLREIIDAEVWQQLADKKARYPLYKLATWLNDSKADEHVHFISMDTEELTEKIGRQLGQVKNGIVMLRTENPNAYATLRNAFFKLINWKVDVPVIIERTYYDISKEQTLLYASTDFGGLLNDGFGDGVMLNHPDADMPFLNSTAFGILQAARTRMTKTEYISCPSCGRTLFDLQETTAMIRKRTDHLKGVKIGIMGCIVNGPGEMADADFGYVGSGKDKITLYKGQEVVKRSVPASKAVDELIQLIKDNGAWNDPE